jgi:hypothetical protein
MNFLTSLPNRKVLFSSDLNLDLLNKSTSARYIVNAYNGSTLLQTTSAAALSTFFENYKRINFGTSTLGLPANTTRYTIDVERYNGNNLVPQYEVFIDNTCSYFNKVNVYYQNKYGAEDVFVFTRKSSLKSNIERKDYDKSVSLNTPYSRQGTNTYSSKVNRQHVLNTDWLTQSESDALSELIESNNVFLQFDGEFILGVKAEITLDFIQLGAEWDFVAPQVLNATKGGITSLTASFPTTSGTYTFAGDLYINEIKPILVASNWNTFFDFDESRITDSQIVLRLVAKQKGTSYTLTSVTAGSPGLNDQIETSNNIAGVDEVIPQRIPVKVDNSNYEYKKKINGDLIQIELTVTEKAHYSRQEK